MTPLVANNKMSLSCPDVVVSFFHNCLTVRKTLGYRNTSVTKDILLKLQFLQTVFMNDDVYADPGQHIVAMSLQSEYPSGPSHVPSPQSGRALVHGHAGLRG